jgi:hypothetical protein
MIIFVDIAKSNLARRDEPLGSSRSSASNDIRKKMFAGKKQYCRRKTILPLQAILEH